MQYMQTINAMTSSSDRMGAFRKMVEYYDIRIDLPRALRTSKGSFARYQVSDRSSDVLCYECSTICEKVAAILHYYIINNYKMKRCEHCGRYFATQTLKSKYCPRNSSYVDPYSQKQRTPTCCEQTVRDAMKQLSRKRFRIEANILDAGSVQFKRFNRKCEQHLKAIKQDHSAANLTRYSEYLESMKKRKAKKPS